MSVRWELDAQSLDGLLTVLHPDREQAALALDELSRALLYFFENRGVSDAPAAVDEVIDRVARRLTEGIAIERPRHYFLGVARHVVKEKRRAEVRAPRPLLHEVPAPAVAGREPALDCLDECLAELTTQRRRWLTRYYGHPPRGRAQARAALARSLGITSRALRLRMHRLRGKLEACIEGCLGRAA